MNLYKITNYKTNAQQIMNEEEKKQFFKINKEWLYNVQNLTLLKRQKKDNILFTSIAVLISVFLYLALCELLAIL
tara:strand:- start:1252 stop:1476 length:225 start_codon:yes stop_codon:yes gene_type:complete